MALGRGELASFNGISHIFIVTKNGKECERQENINKPSLEVITSCDFALEAGTTKAQRNKNEKARDETVECEIRYYARRQVLGLR